MILDQVDWDDAVRDLLKKLSEVYTFMNEDKKLTEIQGMQALYGDNKSPSSRQDACKAR
jgi:hypothetical protein